MCYRRTTLPAPQTGCRQKGKERKRGAAGSGGAGTAGDMDGFSSARYDVGLQADTRRRLSREPLCRLRFFLPNRQRQFGVHFDDVIEQPVEQELQQVDRQFGFPG